LVESLVEEMSVRDLISALGLRREPTLRGWFDEVSVLFAGEIKCLRLGLRLRREPTLRDGINIYALVSRLHPRDGGC
jgi:hypothetical protein